MNTLDYILIAGSTLVGIPMTVVAAEVALAFLPHRPVHTSDSNTLNRPTLAVLIPAHNEELQIAHTVASLRTQLHPHDRILVVADNCSDHTATFAREAGADVLERHHQTERGKGFALAAGMAQLQSNPPQFVLLVDADTTLSEGSITALLSAAARFSAPVQAVYVLSAPAQPSTKDRISAFAFAFKNHVRALGAESLGIPCLLRGTGMAFPWHILSQANLATGNIVEDMQLGIDLALAQHPPRLCAAARVTGGLPTQAAAATTQRTRWEHGHIQTITQNVPRLLGHAISRFRPSLLGLALDLAVPPLALLVVLWALVTMTTAICAWLHFASSVPLLIMLGLGSLLILSILAGWLRFAQHILPFSTLLKVPFYILWKIPLYMAFILKRQRAWVRTAR